MKLLNPATSRNTVASERTRIPMSTPVQRLEAPGIPGYHLHWFYGTTERIQRALAGGYEFVDEQDAAPASTALGSDTTASGNTDMGSRVSVISGSDVGKDGQPIRMILMKIRQELFDEDQGTIQDRNEMVAQSLMHGAVGAERESGADRSQRYLDTKRTTMPDLFNRNKRRPGTATPK